MRMPPKRDSTSEPKRPTGSPFPPIWGSVAAVSCWAARLIPSSDQVPTETGLAVPVHPTPSNSVSGPALASPRVWARPASMVDCPAPVSRTNGYGPLPPMHTSAVSATCPATTLTVSGTFWPPPGCAVAPSQLPPAGGRANVTSGSTCTCRDAAR